jgi:hypothetical protein
LKWHARTESRPVCCVPLPFSLFQKIFKSISFVGQGNDFYRNDAGQMVEDVRLAVNGKVPVEFLVAWAE